MLCFCLQTQRCDGGDAHHDCRVKRERYQINPPALTETVKLSFVKTCSRGPTHNVGLREVEFEGYEGKLCYRQSVKHVWKSIRHADLEFLKVSDGKLQVLFKAGSTLRSSGMGELLQEHFEYRKLCRAF